MLRLVGVLLIAVLGVTAALAQVADPRRARDLAFANRVVVNASRELNRARSAVSERPAPTILTAFAQAQDAFEQARANLRSGDLVGARQFAERCIHLSLDVQAQTVNREDLRRRLERALREIDRLASGAPEVASDPLRAHLARADRKARQAREAYLKGKLDESRVRLKEVEEMLSDARTGTFEPPVTSLTPKKLEAKKRSQIHLEEARAALKRAGESLGAVPPPLAGRTLSAARDYARRAQTFYDERQFDSASANARLAVRLANRSASVER